MTTKTDNNNLFVTAARAKLRFASTKGELSVEQLWDVPLRSTGSDDFNLNTIARAASKTVTAAESEENFVDTNKRTPGLAQAALRLDIIKFVIDAKRDEEDVLKKRADNKKEKERLLEILAEKQDGKLSELSIAELQKKIKAIDAE